MIRNRKVWEQFKAEAQRKLPVDVKRNFKIVEALYREAKALDTGEIPPPQAKEKMKHIYAIISMKKGKIA
jgi:hypothetical protein